MLALLLLLPPLVAVVVDGVNRSLPEVLAQPILWQAAPTSLRIALAAGVLCVVLTMMLLWSSSSYANASKLFADKRWNFRRDVRSLAMPGISWRQALPLNSSVGYLPESADGIVMPPMR